MALHRIGSTMALAVALLAGCQTTPATSSGPAAPDFAVADTSGRAYSLAAMDDQVLILDFWALW